MDKVSLQISISPGDSRLLIYLLPHQLKVWHEQVDEVLIVFDCHGYDKASYKKQISEITEFICKLEKAYPKLCLVTVDYSKEAKAEVSRAFFENKKYVFVANIKNLNHSKNDNYTNSKDPKS